MKDIKFKTGIILVAISAVSFGLMPIFAKIAYSTGVSTFTLLFLRFLVGAVFMFSLLHFRKMQVPSNKEKLIFFFLGAIGYVGQSFCYFMALNYASPGTVSLLFYIYPALVMMGSAVIFKEKITCQKILSLCFALAGAFAIIGGKFDANFIGVFLALMAALIYSVYILVSSKVVKAGSGIQSSAFIMLGAAVVFGAINLFVGFEPPTEFSGFIAVAMIALVCTVLALGAFFEGMERTGPTIASLVSILEPFVTVIASVIILSEKITANLIIGGGLVLASLLITILPNREKAARP